MRGLALISFATVFVIPGVSHASDNQSISDALKQAREAAAQWKPDAELVSIEFFGFSVATDPTTHIPDMSKPGPPNAVMFNFFSRTAKDGIRVTVNMRQLPEEMRKLMEQRGAKRVQVQHFPAPYSPFTLPIPDDVNLDYAKAIATAKQDIAEQCQGDKYGGCGMVTSMELHMFWSGQGDKTGKPVWTIKFGQDPKTLAAIQREVDANTGEVVAIDPRKSEEQQAASFQGTAKPLHNVSVTISQPGFMGVWRGINAAVKQQDPLYKPYAVAITANVSSQRKGEPNIGFGGMYVQYARITPSLNWDDMTAHIQGGGGHFNVIFDPPVRRTGMERQPTTMDPDKLPDSDPALLQLMSGFPPGYHEIYDTDYQGCRSMTVGNLIRQDCGIWMKQEHRTDNVFFWLTRQGNPFWRSPDNPISSELAMVSDRAPKQDWVWWTRVKTASTWKYHMIDIETGQTLPNVCTSPNNGQNQIQSHPC